MLDQHGSNALLEELHLIRGQFDRGNPCRRRGEDREVKRPRAASSHVPH
jgi:hypothetical protein